MADTTLLRVLRSSRLFQGIDVGVLAVLAAESSIWSLQPGERLWTRGETASHFHVVLRGVIELRRAATRQDATIVALFGPGESPGVPVALQHSSYIGDGLATGRGAEVLRVDAAPVLALMATDVSLANAMNRALLEHVKLLHQKIDVLAAGSVACRIAIFLLNLSERFGDENGKGQIVIPLPLSRAQMAAYVSARVETVIRAMSVWQKQGLLETTRDGIVIYDRDALREIVGTAPTDFISPTTLAR